MQKSRQLSLFIAVSLWAILIGGIAYSHIVFFPAYLSQLPESSSLVTGEYGLQDENFWLLVHPLAMLSTILALILNWKLKTRRKLIFIPLGIYVLALIVTTFYFVPGLLAFADSKNVTTVTPAEWLQRGKTWQYMSWVRGTFMFLGFLALLIALTKDKTESSKLQPNS
ncbi:MAG TPA: hypothetical protein VJ765_01955 [Chitinophagaceae bacterium]|nr:hypothetical protein [Chitinophagaceae bacterium]